MIFEVDGGEGGEPEQGQGLEALTGDAVVGGADRGLGFDALDRDLGRDGCALLVHVA